MGLRLAPSCLIVDLPVAAPLFVQEGSHKLVHLSVCSEARHGVVAVPKATRQIQQVGLGENEKRR